MSLSRLGLIVVAAGSSRRMGGLDKVWADLGERPVIWHSLAELAPLAAACVLVVRSPDVLRAERHLVPDFPHLQVVAGGPERQDSVKNGLDVAGDVDAVAIHDGARPFASAGLLRKGVELLAGCDGAIPVCPLPDTVKEVDAAGRIVRTLDRSRLRAAQTPQVFRTDVLRAAHEEARRDGRIGTDDAALLEARGGQVLSFDGDSLNFKITTALDLELARLLYRRGTYR